ncbi:MAG: T9SS type A sorting domain-containing protein [Chitinophagaceae bacterium]|nr:MAG: T9SS type A sorting domain-containing protein [Chitinophagaceae bacterium]
MQEICTFSQRSFMLTPRRIALSLCFFLFSMTSFAQTYCANETVIFSEDFGTGTVAASHPDVVNLTYQASGALNDNFYRVINNTQQRPEWHNAPNHTPASVNGRMLVVNGTAQTFYQREISNGTTGFAPAFYAASLFLMNVNTPGTCGAAALLPTITFRVEYNVDATGTTGWVALQNVTANSVAQSATPTWLQLGGLFSLPVTAQRVRLTMINGTNSGCGNDFAIDDIKFATCPDGGPLPVEFLGVTAQQKGAGVAVNWSTASEFNNKYFDVEKSIDGANWTAFQTVAGAGNSSTVKAYNAYDAKPSAGINYYRIKQVDADGKFKYSQVVKVKIDIEKTNVSVLANPFVNNITVDFMSSSNQFVTVRLSDVSGKMVSSEKWKLTKGNSRLMLNNVANIQRGMYIFTVVDETGVVIYNNKLIKQ